MNHNSGWMELKGLKRVIGTRVELGYELLNDVACYWYVRGMSVPEGGMRVVAVGDQNLTNVFGEVVPTEHCPRQYAKKVHSLSDVRKLKRGLIARGYHHVKAVRVTVRLSLKGKKR